MEADEPAASNFILCLQGTKTKPMAPLIPARPAVIDRRRLTSDRTSPLLRSSSAMELLDLRLQLPADAPMAPPPSSAPAPPTQTPSGRQSAARVWPGILSNAGTTILSTTGFSLNKGGSRTLDVPAAWSGRLWGRTLCTTDTTTGNFACGTGDCGSNNIECSGGGAAPPATLAEFTLAGNDDKDFYDVSLVDGYNLPMVVVPQGGGGSNCTATGCLVQLNGACPADLKVVISSQSVACKSACDAFGSPEYCCRGVYGNSIICKPTVYSEFFKNACPRAYSYAFDDATSTFTCRSGGGYSITFCPSTASEKAWEDPEAGAGLPLINETMVFLGGEQINPAPTMGCVSPLWLTMTMGLATTWVLQRLF